MNFSIQVNILIHHYSTLDHVFHDMVQRDSTGKFFHINTSFLIAPTSVLSSVFLLQGSARTPITHCILLISNRPRGGRVSMMMNRVGEKRRSESTLEGEATILSWARWPLFMILNWFWQQILSFKRENFWCSQEALRSRGMGIVPVPVAS